MRRTEIHKNLTEAQREELHQAIRDKGYGSYEELYNHFKEEYGLDIKFRTFAEYGQRLQKEDEARDALLLNSGERLQRAITFSENRTWIERDMEAECYAAMQREMEKDKAGEKADFEKIKNMVAALRGLRDMRTNEEGLKIRQNQAKLTKRKPKDSDRETAASIREAIGGGQQPITEAGALSVV